jgi:Flp pilus assembly protein TadG
MFKRAQEGVAYIEFAITLPFLLALFMGSVDVTRYILIAQKVEKVSFTVSDIVSQYDTMSTAQLDVLIQAAGEVMKPYTFGAGGYVIVSSVTKTGTASPRVNWQYTGGGSWTRPSQIGSTGNVAILPAGFTMNSGENVIFAEVFYNYSPIINSSVIGAGQVYKVTVHKPRLGALNSLGS